MGALKKSTIKVVVLQVGREGSLAAPVSLYVVEIRGLLGPGRKGVFRATRAIRLARANAFKAKIEENLHLYLRPMPTKGKGKAKRTRKTAWQRVSADKDMV